MVGQTLRIGYADAEVYRLAAMSMPRTIRYSLGAALVLCLLTAAVLLWLKVPPAAARLLPECDALLYANLQPLRTATHFDRTPISRAPDYQAFVDATGIVPERDLDALGLAMHRMDDPRGPNGAVAYSEVFEGRFDAPRLERYLASIAATRESYAGKTIFTIPVGEVSGPGGRRLRVAVVGSGRVAASNAPTTEQIHAMLDRNRSGPSLLAGYGEVPWFAPAWGIGKLGLPFAEDGWVTVAGLRLPLQGDTPYVASVRYLGRGVELRVEELAGTALDASRTAERLSSLLTLLRTLADRQSGDDLTRAAIRSIKLEPRGDRVVLTGTLPPRLLREALAPATMQAPR